MGCVKGIVKENSAFLGCILAPKVFQKMGLLSSLAKWPLWQPRIVPGMW